jgi:hypothetical protein
MVTILYSVSGNVPENARECVVQGISNSVENRMWVNSRKIY